MPKGTITITLDGYTVEITEEDTPVFQHNKATSTVLHK